MSYFKPLLLRTVLLGCRCQPSSLFSWVTCPEKLLLCTSKEGLSSGERRSQKGRYMYGCEKMVVYVFDQSTFFASSCYCQGWWEKGGRPRHAFNLIRRKKKCEGIFLQKLFSPVVLNPSGELGSRNHLLFLLSLFKR